jgi:hypothetical protein
MYITVFVLIHFPEAQDKSNWIQTSENLKEFVWIISQTCLKWPSKGIVKYGHIRLVVA